MTEYIKREDVLKILSGKNAPWNGYIKCKELPAEDVQPVKHGKWLDLWVEDDEIIGGGFMIKQCSVCKEEMYYGEPRYCPDCGAKMDGKDNG